MFYPSTVTLAHKASVDAYHAITYGTGTSTACKYQEMITKVIDSNGDEVLTSAWLMFPASTSVGYDDKITLPDNSTPRIATIQHIKNHMGVEICVEVYLSKDGGFKG